MKTIFFYSVFLFGIFFTNAQKKFLINPEKIDDKTAIVGCFALYDSTETFKQMDFVIRNIQDIKKMANEFFLNPKDEVANFGQSPDFKISVIQNYDDIETWSVNPSFGTVAVDGKTYKFDLKKIYNLSKKFSKHTKHEVKNFSNQKDYQDYLELQKRKPEFLYSWMPEFKYEGNFEVEIIKDSKVDNPTKAIKYLEKEILKFTNEDTFQILYTGTPKNFIQKDQFTLTVSGNRNLFENLSKTLTYKVYDWKSEENEGDFFYEEN